MRWRRPSPKSRTRSSPRNTQLTQRFQDERPLLDSGVRNFEVAIRDALMAEQQQVDVDDARTPSSRRSATALALDRFAHGEQLPGSAWPFDLQHLVEKARLVGVSPGLGLNDVALAQDARSLLT